jgi:hypothetical protein
MQNVINTVKGTALGVAEYLTPVLKVNIDMYWNADQTPLCESVLWVLLRRWQCLDYIVSNYGMSDELFIWKKAVVDQFRYFSICPKELRKTTKTYTFTFCLLINRNPSSEKLECWLLKNLWLPETIWYTTAQPGSGLQVMNVVQNRICHEINSFLLHVMFHAHEDVSRYSALMPIIVILTSTTGHPYIEIYFF